jgi:hypothetical protein
MPIINKGTSFSNGEQLSASKLNDLIDDATFGTESVDNASTLVNASGAITVRDSGITAAKLATGAVTTAKILDANVTFAKLTDVIDDDTMDTATDTTLATSESIKAYVDSNGITQTTGTAPYFGIRAWAHYNQVTDTVEASQNIASIVRTSTGHSTVTFTEAMPSDYYAVSIATNAGQVGGVGVHTIGYISGTPSAAAFTFAAFDNENGSATANNSIVTIIVTA